MDMPNAANTVSGVEIDGETCDVHVRLYNSRDYTLHVEGKEAVVDMIGCAGRAAWVGVYVWPKTHDGASKHGAPLVPGHWYFPTGAEAQALAARFA